MQISTPTPDEMTALIGMPLYKIWLDLCTLTDSKYDMERTWNSGGKKWTFEYKYRRGGKTLCCLYAKEKCVGFMVIFGKNERDNFEATQDQYSGEVQKVYNETATYHDGKWLMLLPKDASLFPDIEKLLQIKRRPNKCHAR